MAGKTYTPTRMVLNQLKGRLKTARRGHKLLKDKRDELMRQFMDVVKRNKQLRIRVEDGLTAAFGSLQVASAINCVVHTMRLPDGSRKTVEIAEVLPLDHGEYRMRSLMHWQTDALAPDGTVTGRFVLGEKPTFAEDARIMGIELPTYA